MGHAFQDWEFLFVETLFVLDPQNPEKLSDRVMFFDHFVKEYRGQKSDLDHYFARLTAEGWEMTMGPWSYDAPDKKQEAVKPWRVPILDHLSWYFLSPGRKLYRFKRAVKR